MNAVLIGAVVVLVSVALSCFGIVLARKYVGLETLQSHNETAGNIFQVVGTLYAVLLGLIVVDAMSTMTDLRLTVDNEADSACNIFILAQGMPSQTRIQIQGIVSSYVDAVIDEEWDGMPSQKMSTNAAIKVFEMWSALVAFQPTDPNMQAIRAKCLEEMTELGDNRRKRVISCLHGVSPVLWTAILLGGILTVSFMFFFGMQSLTAQLIMTASVAASVSMNIYLVYIFGYPFSGAYRLQPEGFIADRAIFTMARAGNLGEKMRGAHGQFLDLRKLHDQRGKLAP